MAKHLVPRVALVMILFCGCSSDDFALLEMRRAGREFIDEARAFERGMEKNIPDGELRDLAQRTSNALSKIPVSTKAGRSAFKADAEALNAKLGECFLTGSPDNATDLNGCRMAIGKLQLALEDLK